MKVQHLSRGRTRRKYDGEITFVYVMDLEIPFGRPQGYRRVPGYAQKLGPYEYDVARTKPECRKIAEAQDMRAVFDERWANKYKVGRVSPRCKPPTSLEAAEEILTEEQLEASRQILAKIREQKTTSARAMAYLTATRMLEEEAVAAVLEMYHAKTDPEGLKPRKSDDTTRTQRARKGALAVAAGMVWLKLKMEENR